jgi:hypothetical protein
LPSRKRGLDIEGQLNYKLEELIYCYHRPCICSGSNDLG